MAFKIFTETVSLTIVLISMVAYVAVAQYNYFYNNPVGPPPTPRPAPSPPPFGMRALVQQDVQNCTDLHCGQEQCCIETLRASICVDLAVVNETTGERACQRYKQCKTDFDCITGSCCVYNPYVTADTTCPPAANPYAYPPHSTAGQVVLPVKGVCVPMANAVNGTCLLSITNQGNCPCGMADGMPLTCEPILPGAIAGTCQVM